MPSPAPNLNEEERAALARARASMAFEGYPTTDEQAVAAVAFIQASELVEKGGKALSLPVEEALSALDSAWEESRAEIKLSVRSE